MKRYRIFLIVNMVLVSSSTFAQHEHQQHKPDSTKKMEMPEMQMSSAILPGLPMQRDGSGTSWHPDSSLMRAIHQQAGAWALMYHGSIFARYTDENVGESGKRGDNQFSAPNWFMLMAQRPAGKHGQVMLRSMISFDRLTEGGDGYPLLFQTGESWKGQPLIDHQHPHDLFAELAVAYGYRLGKEAGFFLYFGLPGEPAIGPPVFMHRPSAQSNPDAPLGHHWQDATHITFGVATAGVRYKIAKLEGSLFTGREPDENRYNFDKPRFDSNSFRLSINPTANLALQISSGFLKSPEALEPEIDVRRTSASLLYNRALDNEKNFAAALVWGQNDPESGEKENSYLLEADLQLQKFAVYTRLESVQKSGHELVLEEFEERLFRIQALTLGAGREIFSAGDLSLQLGAQASLYQFNDELKAFYGSQPFSFAVYLHLRPALLKMNGHGMKGMKM